MTIRSLPSRLPILLGMLALTALIFPAPADAQRRGRPGGGGGGRPPAVVRPVPVRPVVVAPRARVGVVGVGVGVRRTYPASFYRGFGYGFYDPFWMGWGFAGGPWYGQGWYGPGAWGGGWGPGWGPGWGWGQPFGSARLQVRPRQAEVYIDGALAGLVDDFDGFFQRLQVEPGEHELTIYLDGYRTESQRLLFRPNATLDVRLDMQPLPPGEFSGPRPSAMGRQSLPYDMPDMGRMPQQMPPPMPPAQMPPPQGGMGQPPFPMGPMGTRPGAPVATADEAAGFGSVSIRVQPTDARLVIDGEEWSAPEGTGPILVELPAGTHVIEISASGRTPYRRTVDVRAGETVTLNVSLSR